MTEARAFGTDRRTRFQFVEERGTALAGRRCLAHGAPAPGSDTPDDLERARRLPQFASASD